jgi:metal-responsive CopG/Arc/MetJ family transcriptional regulator
MTVGSRVKISVSLPSDLVARVDHEVARGHGESRSGVIETWLRRAGRVEAARELEEATIAYYESRSAASQAEDDEWARFATEDFARRSAR